MKRMAYLIGILGLVLACGLWAASPPQLLNYQGFLRNAANAPLTGSYDVVFRLYDQPGGGNLLLTDAHTAAAGGQVAASAGLFSVQIGGGAVTAGSAPDLAVLFRDHPSVWLEMQVDGDTLAPRTQVTSAAYALSAHSLDGLDSTSFAETLHMQAPAKGGTGIDTSAAPVGSLLTTTATGTWGTLPPGGAGQVLQSNGTELVWANGGGGSDSDWIIDGNNMYSGVSGNVGVGTATPAEKLHVAGTGKFSGDDIGVDASATGNRPDKENVGIKAMAANSAVKNVAVIGAADSQLSPEGNICWGGYFEGRGSLAGGSNSFPVGVYGLSGGALDSTSKGVLGWAFTEAGEAHGVEGYASSQTGTAISVYGQAPDPAGPGMKYAGYFNGDVGVAGALKDSSGSAGTAGQVLTSTGTGTQWGDASGASDDDWIISGNDMYSGVPGNTGIGKTLPYTPLNIQRWANSGDWRSARQLYIQGDNWGGTTGDGLGAVPDKYGLEIGYQFQYGNPSYGGRIQAYATGLANLALEPEGGNVGIGTISPNATLDVNGTVRTNDNDIYLRTSTDTNHGLGWYSDAYGTKKFGTFGPDGPVLYGCAGGGLGTVCFGSQKVALAWNSSGNVGINQPNPQANLDVAGTVQMLGATELLTVGQWYTASTDGFLMGSLYAANGNSGTLGYYTSGEFAEWSISAQQDSSRGISMNSNAFCIPVPKGQAFSTTLLGTGDATVRWIPLGHAQHSLLKGTGVRGAGIARTLVPGAMVHRGAPARVVNDGAAESDGPSEVGAALAQDTDGNVYGKSFRPANADLARSMEVKGPVEAGDVVVMDGGSEALAPCMEEASPLVVGIVAGEPGVVLGAARPGTDGEVRAEGAPVKAPVIVSGIGRCKVDATFGPIAKGDLLVTSPNPGHAMRESDPKAGTVLGKALEALDSGTGTISVLIMLR